MLMVDSVILVLQEEMLPIEWVLLEIVFSHWGIKLSIDSKGGAG